LPGPSSRSWTRSTLRPPGPVGVASRPPDRSFGDAPGVNVPGPGHPPASRYPPRAVEDRGKVISVLRI
jgi:hypothetical protein